ncbi:MAG: lipopolysaccharide biosynthesis protein [Verrucomicrobia bacterium]|nr:lipopolysaccharide biosynthesis protein [Verrucomicrobiota bacterium]
MSHDSSKNKFFRQSGWMIFCTVVSGFAFYGVHPFAKKIPESEYGILGLILAVLNCMSIPSLGLQMVFAQQTAAAVDDRHRRELSGTAHGVLLGTFLIWLAAAVLVVVFREPILAHWKISNSAALWLMLLVGLLSMWLPVFNGILQGQQNFLWVGWSSMLNSTGRLAAVAVVVLVFHGYAAGMTGGILLGVLVSTVIGITFSREVWRGRGAPVPWKSWLARVVPLTFGFGAFQFMFSADPLFVKAWFDETTTAYYIAAGTLGRALVAFTGPVVNVMFPKVVRSVALAEKTSVVGLTLIITAVLAGLGALGLSLVAPWLLVKVYKDTYVAAVPLLPWFAAGMAPLALANVLLNDLMARSRFKVVPWLIVIVAGYATALNFHHASFVAVIQVIGVFNLVFLAVVGLFAWIDAKTGAAPAPPGENFLNRHRAVSP